MPQTMTTAVTVKKKSISTGRLNKQGKIPLLDEISKYWIDQLKMRKLYSSLCCQLKP